MPDARRRPTGRDAPEGTLALAPILITPTKPLTPSHFKGLLWLDVLYKATAILRDTVYLTNRRTFDVSLQTVGFWAYMDARYPDEDYRHRSERWVGERYVEFHRDAPTLTLSPSAVAAYRARVERDGWVHAISDRVLDIWASHYRALNLYDPGLRRSEPLALTREGVLDELGRLGCLLDLRPLGGAVYVDLTEQGIPLRQLVDAGGVDNYLLSALRELLPMARSFRTVLLLSDEDLTADYVVIERVLARVGARAFRLSLGRVPLDGAVKASREGGWEAYLFERFLERYLPRRGEDVFRLGMRLYFVAGLGRTAGRGFCFDELDGAMSRAARLLDRFPPAADASQLEAVLRSQLAHHGNVDPYRLTSLLFANRPHPAAGVVLPLFL